MKISITIDHERVLVVRQHPGDRGPRPAEHLLDCALESRTGEEVAALVAKTVGIAVAKEIAAATGGD